MVRYDQQLLIESCPGPVDDDFRAVDVVRGIKVMNLWYQSKSFHKRNAAIRSMAEDLAKEGVLPTYVRVSKRLRGKVMSGDTEN